MLVVKIGGPAYRIGMGGGAASSVPSGSNSADLDFNAVQRGDAEMSQKLWRVVRRCVGCLEHYVLCVCEACGVGLRGARRRDGPGAVARRAQGRSQRLCVCRVCSVSKRKL